jgi:type IX secretion system PorP/SprF family membrane protein
MKNIAMKKKYLQIICFTCMSLGMHLYAQQNPQNSFYMLNPLSYNPAYAGSRGSINLTALGRFQWTGIDGAPMTQFLTVHMPFRNQSIGVGLHISNDRIGSRTSQAIYADFAYAIRLNKKEDRLSFGITGGVDLNQFNFNGLTVTDPTDLNYLNSYSGANPNFGAGIYYYGKRHYLGISVPRLLESSLSNSTSSTAVIKRHYYLAAGYVFKLGSVVDFKPSVLLKIAENAPFTFDVNASFYLFERFWIGGMYRFNESAGLNFIYNFKNIMHIGYAFDYPYNDLRTNNFGSHEVVLGFDFMKKKQTVKSARYF